MVCILNSRNVVVTFWFLEGYMMEKAKQWILPLLVGAVLGAIALATVGGFISGNSARTLAGQAAEDATVAVLAPMCAANAQADPEKLAEIKEMRSYQQRSAISDTGWVSYPDGASSSLKRAVDQACVDLITG